MKIVVVAAGAVVLLVICGVVYVARRNRLAAPEATDVPPSPEIARERELRHQRIDVQGTELLERRVELDGRRGTLGGDSGLLDAMSALEEGYHRGEITEAAFEEEKIRLLGG